MKRRIVSIVLVLVLALGVVALSAAVEGARTQPLGSASAAEADTARQAIAKAAEAFEAAEPIREKLVEIITDEIAAFESEIDDDTEYDIEEAQAELD